MRVKSRISASQLRLAFCALAGSLMSFVLLATYSPYIVRNSTVGTVFTSSGTATSGSIFSGARVRNFRDTRPVRLLGPASHKDLETVLASGAPVNCRLWAVVTTIFTPSEAVKRTAGLLPGWCMVVVADRKGPKGYAIDEAPANIFYLTTAYQEKWAALSPFVDSLPWNHFGRKNVGYLWAITHGAQQVWDFDDDNELVGDGIVFPNDSTRIFSLPNFAAEALNPYPIMGAPTAWPRGFPLEQIKNGSTIPTSDEGLLGSWDAQKIGVIQSLANHDPDVDAIYRLTRPLPLYFERPSPNEILLIPRNTLTPYNAQATLHLHSALWALLLPITVHGRVSDIWRGYAMQRLLWDAGLHVAFSGPWVRQERNPHSWLADLQAETDLFAKSGKLVEFLQSWKGTGETLPERIEQLFIELYERSYIELDDVHLAQRWVAELAFAGYIFPPIVRKLTLAVRTFGGDIGRLNDG
ncbi:uncharacterized protein EV422DRAFT_279122 [Fimicolochytrium jonesii]|uniref:uncharacterized protein n=1 Tax=Fimicolochytrium jonesii TaxID=1396493 RepID=UPI0022FED580|nr:uncharacterized protein EV422DRAFT_279122 [Fimicolochytrium jonesii]KAI8816569.1 hypothetical protein EV422DRAFT_279122 [Fimicolochytrium jonesii]